ncbi:hypothetical protein [Lactiplantibacillus plantarum]
MDNNKQTLATNELATIPLDHNWYQKLASNFELIQQYLNKFDELTDEVDSYKSSQSTDLIQKLADMQQQMNSKINRITLGTDEDTIRLVVTAILQEQGVIK